MSDDIIRNRPIDKSQKFYRSWKSARYRGHVTNGWWHYNVFLDAIGIQSHPLRKFQSLNRYLNWSPTNTGWMTNTERDRMLVHKEADMPVREWIEKHGLSVEELDTLESGPNIEGAMSSHPLHRLWKRYKGTPPHCRSRYQPWAQFETFLKDIGLPPSPEHSLRHIDKSAGYSPATLKWMTNAEAMAIDLPYVYRRPKYEK